jgi:5-methylcytosine-specific restriction endonuclease McrA
LSRRFETRYVYGLLSLFLLLSAAAGEENASVAAANRNPHGPLKIACENCHTSKGWLPLRAKPEFDHGKTAFPLRGLHSKVPCEECHVNPVFANAGEQCQDCHADIHRRRNSAQCDLCHNVNGWEVSVHNINEHQDRFPLIGAHAAVDCYACHKAGAVGQFNRQALSTECVSCHLKAYNTAKSPNHRAQGFSMDCRECHHSMDSWLIGATPLLQPRRK